MRAWRNISMALLLGGLPLPCLAQHAGPPGGGGPPGPSMGGGFPPGGDPGGFPDRRGGMPPPGNAPDSGGTVSTMRGGLQLGPPGRWWDDKHFARDLRLKPDQQRHMDAIFEQNRGVILQRYQAYLEAQSALERLTQASVPDEAALIAQIERVGHARIDLEESNTHMLIAILRTMDEEQRARLSSHR